MEVFVAGSVNKVILVGNLGKDPEIRFMPDGTKVANFSIATSESWKDKTSGERRERTEWHRISVMNDKVADIVEKYVRKGSKVYVEGQLQTRKWTDQSGQEKYTTETIIGRFRGELALLDSKSGGSNDAEFMGGGFDDGQQDYAPKAAAKPAQKFDELDDDVPF
jgi:single-strand DNA-binding protein